MSTLQRPSTSWPEATESSEYVDDEFRSDSLDNYTPFSDQETILSEYEDQDEEEDEPVNEVTEEVESYLTAEENETASETTRLYGSMDLARRGMREDTFRMTMNGYRKLKDNDALKVTRYLTVCDFSQPGTEKRMYVIDITGQKILVQCKVSHGKNSVRKGDHKKNATLFSNRIGSNQSSLGFYVTANTYQGKHGLSLVLEGKEESFNANARRRKVVVHGARYVREDDSSPAGLSWGCPAIDMKLVNPVINTIKGGSCLFIFARDPEYLQQSTLASAQGVIGAVRDIASSVWKAGSTILSSFAIPKPTSPQTTGSKTDPKTIERIRKFDDIIERVSREHKFNPDIVRGIIAAESGGNPRSGEGRTGYKGLMQADRGTDQFDPETSIRKGVEKFNQFKGYLKAGLARLKINYTPPDDEAYAQMVLACYNAGHVTVIKAIQYAHQAGNGRNWLQPEYYQRALLFSGGYDYYSSCTKNRSAAEVQKAKEQGKAYRFSRNRHWAIHKDPPQWTNVSTLLSPVLACWIRTKMTNTPGYLNRFITYFRSFSAGGNALQSRETLPDSEAYEAQAVNDEVEKLESPEQLYGPEYFDTSEMEHESPEDLFAPVSEEEELYDESEDTSDSFEMDREEQELLAQWEHDHADEAPGLTHAEDEQGVATGALTVPSMISDDTKVASYTCYVRIPIGKGNYTLDRTGIYIPASFTPAEPVTIILYLHGMTGTFPGPAAMIDKYWEAVRLPAYDFRLREEISRANKNVILIAPSLGNSPNAYKNSLSNSGGGLDNYLTKTIQAINHYVCQTRYNISAMNFSKLVLAAHSAGGSQMRKIAMANNPIYGGRISECWGFDSLYGGMSGWLRWAKDYPDKKLFIYYKSSTQGNALWLKNMSKKLSNVLIVKSSARNHYLVPKEHLRERVVNL